MRSAYIFILTLGMLACRNDQNIDNLETTAAEQHRLIYHFTPDSMWMNDPNGLVFLDGEYHLFYQYYPDSTVWGPMHWGHAVSKDLVQWEHLPVALYPDSLGWIFSGSAVYDRSNTSGLGSNDKGPLIAIFTHHSDPLEKTGSNLFQYQSLAYSNDNGRTWTKYPGNPVLPNPGIRDFRDPKVFWYEADQSWRLILAVQNHVSIYKSPNLLEWTKLSDFGVNYGSHNGVWECPDLFPLTDETGIEKWVMLVSINPGGPQGGSATQYFVGSFDGTDFIPDHPEMYIDEKATWLDMGTDNYAGVTWSNVPESDGRRLFIGWMSNWNYANRVPTKRWRSASTLPRELRLVSNDKAHMVVSIPVSELKALENGGLELKNFTAFQDTSIFTSKTGAFKIEVTALNSGSGLIAFRIKNINNEYVDIGFDAEQNGYFVDRTFAGTHDFNDKFADFFNAPVGYSHDTVKMTIYLDVASVELFADGGKTVMTHIFFPSAPLNEVLLLAESGNVHLLNASCKELQIPK